MSMHSVPFPGDLAVIALSPHQWRVSDPAREEHDGLSVLGFVERCPSGFEVTALQSPRDRRLCPTFERAIASLRHPDHPYPG